MAARLRGRSALPQRDRIVAEELAECPPPKEAVRAAKAEQRAAKAERAEALERVEADLDAAVAERLEALAREATWDGAPREPEDPYAVRVGMRVDEARGCRWLVLHASKTNPNRDELHVEFQTRMKP